MMRKMIEEIKKTEKVIGKERLLLWMPCYVYCAGNGRFESVSVEMLMEEMEGLGIFSQQSDGWLLLHQEYGRVLPEADEMLGFADDSGRFYSSLDQWVSYLSREHLIMQGILLLRMGGKLREMEDERVWWNQFFRQLKRYKRDYLVIMEIGDENRKEDLAWLESRIFCREFKLQQPESLDYLCGLKYELMSMGLRLDERAEQAFTDLLERHRSMVDCEVVENWKKDILWNYLVSRRTRTSYITEAYIQEASLLKFIGNDAGHSCIGF